jgi:hypothetical protein
MNPNQVINGISVILLAAGVARAMPDWEQANSNGFGDPQAGEVTAVEAFNGYLYAGIHNPIDPEPLYDGARIFRSSDGVTWTAVTQPGFGNSHDVAPPAILDFVVFNNRLYASTGRGNAAQIWRSLNGTIWAPMTVTGFSDPDNVDIASLTVYEGMIYAGVRNEVTGAQIWRSFSGDNNTWTKVAPAAPGTTDATITGLAEFKGELYAAVQSELPARVWRSHGGAPGTWTTLVDDGFGDPDTIWTGGMSPFAGSLYVGAGNEATGALLYRTDDGATWTQAMTPGFGDPNNRQVDLVYVFQNKLYVGVSNSVTGIEIWRSADGTVWEQAAQDGFGDGNNTAANRSHAAGVFLSQLYVGTSNVVDGGELWRKSDELFLTVPPDFDEDGDVDRDDLDAFQTCASGPAVPLAVGCAQANMDGDTDADQADFAVLQRCLTGPYVPADPTCAD